MSDNNPPQDLAAEVQWFHMFRAMIENGDVAKMGPHAFAVYVVVKSHANFNTGHAFPALETIATKAGMSVAQVKRELKVLEDLGYLTKEKQGRSNVYTLREKIDIIEDGKPTAIASWDYMPGSIKHAVADLKNVLLTGQIGAARVVFIERLSVNVSREHSAQVNINNPVGVGIPEETRSKIKEILKDARKG